MNNLSNDRASDSDIQQIIDSTEKGTTMFVPADVYYRIAKELLALREAGKEPVAWRYRTTDINGNPKPGWSFSETESLLGLYQPLYAAPQLPAVPDDTKRMDWLCSKTVEVRDPMVYGSHHMFYSQCDSDDDEPHHTRLRAQIDAAIAAAPKPE